MINAVIHKGSLIRWMSIVMFTQFFLQSFYVIAESQFTVFHYKSSDYKIGTQNWDLCSDDKGRLFVANNAGLLVMEGSDVRLFQLPRKGVVRSVACISNRVYTGSFEEFGYWEEQKGNWEYHSLVHLVDPELFQNDEIWKIVLHNENVYFQSFGNIFVYDGTIVNLLDLRGPVLFLLQSGGRLFVQEINGGILEIIDGKTYLLQGSEVFSDNEVKTILQFEKGKYIIGTGSKGLFYFDGKSFQAWPAEVSALLKQYKLNNGLLMGNKLVFGTILKGIIVADLSGKLIQHIHSGNGLQNNTVLSLHAAGDGNVWAGLDRGIDQIWLTSPLRSYRDTYTEAGSVYSAAVFEEKLYIGTNQGIYYFSIESDFHIHNRRFLSGSQGQVWFIRVEDGKLYCGLNDGTYWINNDKLERVSDVNGGYNLLRHRIDGQDVMLQSTYTDLVLFRKNNGIWRKHYTLSNFSAPVRFMSIDHLGHIFLGHTVRGIFMAEPSSDFDQIISLKVLGEKDGLVGDGNRVYTIENRVVVPTDKGFYQWDALKQSFVAFNELNNDLGSFFNAKTVIDAGNGKYWMIKADELGLFRIRLGRAAMLNRLIPEMYGLSLVDQYENIVALNDSLHLICLDDGFALLNLARMERFSESYQAPTIRSIQFVNSSGQSSFYGGTNAGSKLMADHGFNSVRIVFSHHKGLVNRNFVQYYLEGFETEWSGWSSANRVDYMRLPPGNYVFRIKGLTPKGFETEEVSVSFRIRPPWYLTRYAFAGYFLLSFLFVLLLRGNYKRRQWRRQEQMLREENEQMKTRNKQAEAELMRISNDLLQKEVVAKNMELAKNTMAMLRKNELLIDIRGELDKQRDELGSRLPLRYYTKINKLIESSLNSEHDWEMFEHLFDQAHENFFRRLKASYPELTPSDFRLCAYLRMNLSSKEIAPLLNISIRGVEEKRYRLRKKLNLSPEQNLTEFIISF